MKWKSSSRVAQSVKDKIEIMINNFDTFIKQTHGSSSNQEDEKVFKDWKDFKQLLQNNPDDIEAHQEFMTKMSDTKIKESRNVIPIKKNASRLDLTKTVLEKRKSRDFQIDKEKLKNNIHAFFNLLEKNNRDILKISN